MNRDFLRAALALVLSLIFVSEAGCGAVFAKTKKDELDAAITEAKQKKTEATDKLSKTQDELGSLKYGKSELENYLNQLNKDLTEVSEEISEIEEKIIAKENAIRSIKNRIDYLGEQMADAQSELVDTQVELDEHYDYMKKRIRYLYEQGQTEYFAAILMYQDMAGALNRAEYVRRISSYDQKVLRQIQEKEALIKERKEKIEADRAEIAANIADEEAEIEMLHGLEEDATSWQSRIQGLIYGTGENLKKYMSQIDEMEAAAEKYEEEIAKRDQDIQQLQSQLAEEKKLESKSASMETRDISQVSVAGGERDILAALIFCEAGNQPYEGQVAVGAVVMNRVRSGAFPNTITGVIYQSGQFTPASSGRLAARIAKGAPESCYMAADAALLGQSPVGGCLFFRRVTPRINGIVIGDHVFYNATNI